MSFTGHLTSKFLEFLFSSIEGWFSTILDYYELIVG